MIHYHGTPITPQSILWELAGEFFCVRYGEHRDMEFCQKCGQGVMVDNGAFGAETKGTLTDWDGFFKFVRPYLDSWNTWAVIPDVISGTEQENWELILRTRRALPDCARQLAPVWHLHESFDYLDALVNQFHRVCFGSSKQYWKIGSPSWNNRMNEAFNRICKGTGKPPTPIHMLRGMALSRSPYPFASVDSADVARNHEQVPGRALRMARRWDALQCPARWEAKPIQAVLSESGVVRSEWK